VFSDYAALFVLFPLIKLLGFRMSVN